MPPRRWVAVQTAANEPHGRTAEKAEPENGYSDDSADSTRRKLARVVAARENAIDGKVEGVSDDLFRVGVRREGDISDPGNELAGTFPGQSAAEVSSGNLTPLNAKWSPEIITG